MAHRHRCACTQRTRHQREAFKVAFVDYLRRIDARYLGRDAALPWRLQTRYGALDVAPHDFGMHARFRDPQLAASHVACNPHTGKWNCYFDDDDFDAGDFVLSALKAQLEAVLLQVPYP